MKPQNQQQPQQQQQQLQQQQQPIRKCAACEKDIRDIEPAQCSCCEAYFHVAQECCNATRSSIHLLFNCHKALWLCVKCRKMFAKRTLHAFLEDKIRQPPEVDAPAESRELRKDDEMQELRAQVAALNTLVTNLLGKLEQLQPVTWPSQPAPLVNSTPSPPLADGERARDRSSRRRGPFNEQVAAPSRSLVACGTGDIDLSDLQLSCPVAANAPPPKCWVYLSGFNPKIHDDDVVKIVKRCLDSDADVETHRLVPKKADTSTYTFVSFKVGVDVSLKEKAFNLNTWPPSIRVRQFINVSKNDPKLNDPRQDSKSPNPESDVVLVVQPSEAETDQ